MVRNTLFRSRHDLRDRVGLWLPGSVWDPVAADLVRAGHRPIVPALPGVDVDRPGADLDDQLAAVPVAVDAATRPIVVGHSAAATLARLAADRRPERVGRVVLIGGFPETDGNAYADLFPGHDGAMPFPGWEPFEGPDAHDLDGHVRKTVAAAAVPVPEGVARAVVGLRDRRRSRVPVTVICPEFSPGDARGWVTGGQVPELAGAADVSYVDSDSGHWPMLTRSAELAHILDVVAQQH